MEQPEREYFKIGLSLGGVEVIGFEVSAQSSNIKRWAFFGLLSMLVAAIIFDELYPIIKELTNV